MSDNRFERLRAMILVYGAQRELSGAYGALGRHEPWVESETITYGQMEHILQHLEEEYGDEPEVDAEVEENLEKVKANRPNQPVVLDHHEQLPTTPGSWIHVLAVGDGEDSRRASPGISFTLTENGTWGSPAHVRATEKLGGYRFYPDEISEFIIIHNEGDKA